MCGLWRYFATQKRNNGGKGLSFHVSRASSSYVTVSKCDMLEIFCGILNNTELIPQIWCGCNKEQEGSQRGE